MAGFGNYLAPMLVGAPDEHVQLAFLHARSGSIL